MLANQLLDSHWAMPVEHNTNDTAAPSPPFANIDFNANGFYPLG